jgi:hypothetical protein
VPKFRNVSRNLIEELEIFFQKEIFTFGYPLIKSADYNDHVYFIFKGEVSVYLPTPEEIKRTFSQEETKSKKFIQLFKYGIVNFCKK